MPTVYWRTVTATVLLFLVYLSGTLAVNDTMGNLLSPLCAGLAGAFLLRTFWMANRKNPKSYVWLLLSLGGFSWMLGDVLWTFADYSGWEPDRFMPSVLCYSATNALFAVGVTGFIILHMKKWNLLQLFLDTLTVFLLSMTLLWSCFFNRSFAMAADYMLSDSISAACILLDLCVMVGILVWLLSVRSGHVPVCFRVIAGGIFLFAIADLLYYYFDYNEIYVANSWIDAAYVAALLITALGGLGWRHSPKEKKREIETFVNVGFRQRNWFLSCYPIVALALGLVRPNAFLHYDLLLYCGIIVLYWVFSGYVQKSIQIERLLHRETEMNAELERRVREQTEELIALANEDPLTRLSNRRHFLQQLEEALQTYAPDKILALVLLDTDRFKIINDTYGHDIGDRVLIEIAERMQRWNTCDAVLARHGGDEFLMMLQGCSTHTEIADKVRSLMKACSDPIRVYHYEIHITFSAGIAVCPEDSDSSIELLRYADIAMYHAKSLGTNRFVFFDLFLHEKVRKKNRIELLLKKADLQKDFTLFYQPQFSLPDCKLVGVEALLRWNHAEHGYISPAVFIPVMEELGYMTRVGAFVAETAIEQAARWEFSYGRKLKVGINISPVQLKDREFIESLRAIIADTRVDTKCLDLEITESAMLEDSTELDNTFAAFQSMGLSVSMDDFGVGYSSLQHLRKYPFNRIKIDKSLIDNIAKAGNNRNIVKAIIAMSQSISMKTLAEGVETDEQLQILCELGCDEMQGYLLGKPMPKEQFEKTFLEQEIRKVQ